MFAPTHRRYRAPNDEQEFRVSDVRPPRVSAHAIGFFAAASVYLLAGVALGIYMAVSRDHSLLPVHAHTNLLGWATMAIMGSFYWLAGARAPAALGWATFGCLNAATLLMLPILAMILKGDVSLAPLLRIAMGLAVLAVLLFLVSLIRVARWR
jgi:hypothetical protein